MTSSSVVDTRCSPNPVLPGHRKHACSNPTGVGHSVIPSRRSSCIPAPLSNAGSSMPPSHAGLPDPTRVLRTTPTRPTPRYFHDLILPAGLATELIEGACEVGDKHSFEAGFLEEDVDEVAFLLMTALHKMLPKEKYAEIAELGYLPSELRHEILCAGRGFVASEPSLAEVRQNSSVRLNGRMTFKRPSRMSRS